MKFSLAINESKKNAIEMARQFSHFLFQAGAEVVNVSSQFESEFAMSDVLLTDNLCDDVDILVTFGGDGTLLRHASLAAVQDLPILGINVGTIGFLTGAETSSLNDVAKSLLSGDYLIEERAMLKVTAGDNTYLALNEVVLSRGASDKLAEFKVYVDNAQVDTYRADGFIVSTATGSTAYALSAGGPVLSPSVKGLVLTPICSHCLHSRPVVVSSDECVMIETLSSGMDMEIDGQGHAFDGMKIYASTAIEKLKLVRTNKESFYKKLLCKLNQWSKS